MAQPPLAPPRLTGDYAGNDFAALRKWLGDFYQNTVTDNGLLDPNRQARLQGQITIAETDTSATLTFTKLAGTVSAIAVPVSSIGAPPDGAFIVESVASTSTTVTLTLRAAPGADASVTFNIITLTAAA